MINTEQERFEVLLNAIQQDDGSLLPLSKLLQRTADQYPERIALLCQNKSITYKELYARAVHCSQRLIARGVKPGDRVVLWFANSTEFYIAYFGIVQTGAVVVPLNVFLKEKEVAHVITDAQPTCLVISSEFKTILDKVTVSLPPVIDETDEAFVTSTDNTKNFVPQECDSQALVVLLYTSGTTGLPKGVMLSTENIMNNLAAGLARLGFTQHERVFCVLPLFHSFAQSTCVWGPILMGATVIVVPKITRRGILDGLKHKPTVFLGVPSLYGLLCLLRTAPIDDVRIFISGGDALPDKIRMAFGLLYRRKICNGYGLTEASPLISVDIDDTVENAGNIGRPLVGVDVAFKDDDDNDVPIGGIGEIWVRGKNVMLGYYNAPDMTKQMLVDGWLRTGDLGYLDNNGKLVISGREKDLIIHKGFNIYPQEIENVIMTHASVIRVGVIGRDNESVGQIPIAYVQLKKNVPDIETTLKNLCARALAPYKVPRVFVCSTKSLPVTATGKVDKKILRNQSLQI